MGQVCHKGSHLAGAEGGKNRGPGLVSNFRREELRKRCQKNSLMQFSLLNSILKRACSRP